MTRASHIPRISVIVPIHDVARHVSACIASILAQSLGDFEIIAVDDGSTDGSGRIAAAAAGGDARFRLVAQPNGGLSAARNAGLDLARGALIAFVDSDDRIAPDYLERLERALTVTGADWVACGTAFCPPEGDPVPHPALHGLSPAEAADLSQRAMALYPLEDWCDVVRHFPSAWNKLYRRELIGDIRFDEGLHYEDHAFFYRLACRTRSLVHLHAPLYLSTQGRAGQITRDDSDRVFEQFTVLDSLRAIVAGSDKTGGDRAMARVTTRLTFERSQAVRDADRRARLLARARTALEGARADDALGVPAFWMSLLAGRVPVSVVIPSDGDVPALERTLASLAGQTLPEAERLVVADGPAAGAAIAACARTAGARLLGTPGTGAMTDRVAEARNAGLAAADGETLVFLDAGDTLPPDALATWHNRLIRSGAGLGFARFVMAGAGQDAAHTGLHDRHGLEPRLTPEPGADDPGFVPAPGDALYIHAHPSAKIFLTEMLRGHGLRFAPGPLSSWRMLFEAVECAARILYLPGPPPRLSDRPEGRRLWHAPAAPRDLVAAVDDIAAACPGAVSPQVRGRLVVRAIWEKINFADFPAPVDRAAFEAEARAVLAGLARAHETVPDPYVGARLRGMLAAGARD